MQFTLEKTDDQTAARAGEVVTDHGNIPTPVFMPVGTVGSVKGIHVNDLKEEVKAHIILGNTYHLYLRPGLEVLEQAGGLHRFNAWDKPILTDSGGFQVFSLSDKRKLTAEGAEFQSHLDGSRHLFTPENVVDIQRTIGADIIMAFDECPPGDADYKYALQSMELTHKWLKRGLDRFDTTDPKYGYSQTFFPIVQGAGYADLRRKSAEYIASFNREGNAIGGLAVGEPEDVMYEMIEVVNEILPEDKPRYLMGVGTPVNLLEAISRGVDMFDCVMPTRNGRNGMLFTSEGIINIRNEKWKNDFSPVDPDGHCSFDTIYSKAYLRHLFISREMLGPQVASIHNLSFYLWLVGEARRRILDGTFSGWKDQMVKQLARRL
ncbi:tRNA guanosine(34) transglycosylase Tgt [Marinilabilia salmonicolor]|jgi:queuine tRNA-ribosyltransferase|uniref:Queuine tRNA-ribosyltransferase n=1 Tax=Marinilabilia salmonicolor TaxID=989 RepID=A0A2T0XA67_9BACT|nr:tRNA guanosine(34) transglycosylase Tgt [Marinilabilia salmonicolor]PRY95836.1 tRNA-guanine transglycosylase [Marinilabilia salmonicolor]RCW36611.1 tRNA-guanine transglycosylase [Marinilabilia salmonicolor]